MYFVVIDCGTTNSRAYVVDADGKVFATAKKTVGVRDTSITGSREKLLSGLQEISEKAVAEVGLQQSDITAILSSGMITSEIGLIEIPHTLPPCGEDKLASTIVRVDDARILGDVPVYFVRGIRNPIPDSDERPSLKAATLDLMRGEETQIIGMIAREALTLPIMIVGLSSHTKFMPVDESGCILGSLTTISGQLYDVIVNGTFLHKSVVQNDGDEPCPADYFDEAIVKDALDWYDKVGLVRASMYIRFMDVFLKNKWYERQLFLDALVAADDLRCIGQLDILTKEPVQRFHLVGHKVRCRLYTYLLHQLAPEAEITSQYDAGVIDQYSITGILKIAKKAGIVK